MFDNVQYEKEKAMEIFNKFQRMKKIFKVFEIVFVLLLLSWSTKKIRFPGKIFELSVYVSNPHIVFLIGNAIILALFLLCKQHGAGSGDDDLLYKEYSTAPETSPAVEKVVMEKEETKEVVVEEVKCEEVEVAIAAAEKEIMRFQRTFSEKLKVEIAVRPKKELRRSETENGRAVLSHVGGGGGSGGGGGGGGERRVVRPLFKTVEHLTNEEFKLAIDAYIDKQKRCF